MSDPSTQPGEPGEQPPPSTPTPPQSAAPPGPPGGKETHRVPITRAGRTWIALIVGLVALVLILVFILQNLDSVKVTFFTASGSFPLAVALLFAAVLGAATVLLIGSIRIVQLRHQVRRKQRLERQAPPPNPPAPPQA